ncbi:hypothetical protein [Limnobacter sp.]|uniref:hypothetical protein n=1 Tax=Limnobacter sp. TaxID=2003368 RepID=UPI00311EFEB1
MNNGKSNVAERVAAHKARKESAGFKRISIFVAEETDRRIRALAKGGMTKGEVVDNIFKNLG